MNLAGEAVGRQPLGHRVGIEKCLVDALGRRAQHAMKSDVVRGHEAMPFDVRYVAPATENRVRIHAREVATHAM
jgi:hypothetical protein